ncbi:MAG TPA: SDR family oxidoreductase, partial [Anseongella sp.]|nr:SDR family oxidoreductase [Anseongella sp.]
MDLELKNKVALVTGASKGIGKAVALELAAEGADLIMCARHEGELAAAGEEVSAAGEGLVLTVVADMTREEDLQALVEKSREKFGRIDILVNNAGGIGRAASFADLSTRDWRNLFELNLFSVVTLTRLVLPLMQENKWGRIINISSENAEQPYPDMPAYNVSKGALNNLS